MLCNDEDEDGDDDEDGNDGDDDDGDDDDDDVDAGDDVDGAVLFLLSMLQTRQVDKCRRVSFGACSRRRLARQAEWPQVLRPSPHPSEAMLPREVIELPVEVARFIPLEPSQVLRRHVCNFPRVKFPRMLLHEASEVS